MSRKSVKKAPSKLRRTPANAKTVIMVLVKAVLLLVWVWAVIVVIQWLLGQLMLFILGRELLLEPVWTAVYSALSYVLAFLVLLFATPQLQLLAKNSRVRKNTVKTVSADVIIKAGSEAKIMDRAELGLKGLPTWMDVGLAPVGYIVATLLAAGLVALVGQIFPNFDVGEAQQLSFSTYIWGVDRIIAFIVLVVVAPIAEELIFRGWLYGKLRTKLTAKLGEKWSLILAILMVSILFGIMHGQWNVGITVFVLSVVMCVLREITGTIYAGTLVHMLKNAIAFYLLYVIGMGM